MTKEERTLIVETLGEMRSLHGEMKEFKGEMKEFKEHVVGRVSRLEKKEGEKSKERLSLFSVLIAGAALAVTIIVNFFRNGGK
jgi:uncharacterized membrane protein (DUF106 family)